MAKKEAKQAFRMAPVQAPAKEAAMPVEPQKISFDAWWAMTAKKLPLHHHKEIVKADFKARGLSIHETIAAYNNALEQYGVKSK